MIFFCILVIAWALMMVFPFSVGFVSMRDDVEEKPLTVKNDNVRDPRYFAKSFIAMMDRVLADRKGDKVMLSKEERVIDGEMVRGLKDVDDLVVAQGKLFTDDGCTFHKEILARQYAGIGRYNRLRAVAAEGALTLREGCEVERWVDASEALRVQENCFLGISATSNERIVVDKGCIFRRLYAPQIIAGKDDKVRCIDKCCIYKQEKVFKEPLWDVDRVEDGDKVENTLISTGNLKIGKGAVVYGDVKSDKNIRVMKGATITGNLIADGVITLEDNVTVRGVLFSQESILIGKGNVIGECGMIKSVVAREKVVICVGAVIYGYISGEKPCVILDEEQYYKEIQNTY